MFHKKPVYEKRTLLYTQESTLTLTCKTIYITPGHPSKEVKKRCKFDIQSITLRYTAQYDTSMIWGKGSPRTMMSHVTRTWKRPDVVYCRIFWLRIWLFRPFWKFSKRKIVEWVGSIYKNYLFIRIYIHTGFSVSVIKLLFCVYNIVGSLQLPRSLLKLLNVWEPIGWVFNSKKKLDKECQNQLKSNHFFEISLTRMRFAGKLVTPCIVCRVKHEKERVP